LPRVTQKRHQSRNEDNCLLAELKAGVAAVCLSLDLLIPSPEWDKEASAGSVFKEAVVCIYLGGYWRRIPVSGLTVGVYDSVFSKVIASSCCK
jgi:hypothetical protein